MICSKCVKPQQLKDLIDARGELNECQYCHILGAAVERDVLFDRLIDLIDKNVAIEDDLTEYELGLLYECGSDFVSIETIDIVLSEWFDLGDDPYFDDLIAYLPASYLKDDRGHDRHYFSDDGYLEKNCYEAEWQAFIEGIKHAHRFFNPSATKFLDSVFSSLRTGDGELKPDVVRTLRSGEELYRARTVADRDAAKKIQNSPHTELGPAPKDKATSQRMTPHGIAALYCALERTTCLSEIRSITGDVVVSGAMTPTTHLKFLDLTKLELVEPPELTFFDDGFRDSLHLSAFLKSLVKKMSKPKGRHDELSYLSTQVVFEFLRLQFGMQVDGLVFPSVQTGETGTNVVLFPEACVVSSRTFRPPDELEKALGPDPRVDIEPFADGEKLAFVADSLRYHRITAIETKSDTHERVTDLFAIDLHRGGF